MMRVTRAFCFATGRIQQDKTASQCEVNASGQQRQHRPDVWPSATGSESADCANVMQARTRAKNSVRLQRIGKATAGRNGSRGPVNRWEAHRLLSPSERQEGGGGQWVTDANICVRLPMT
jgi:hypothetical protein